jgi:hypothetical protein
MMDGPGGRAVAPRESLYSEALGEAICARVAAGESLHAIARDEAMPERTTVYRWLKVHPDFATALQAAQRSARVARRLREQAASGAARARALANPRAWGGMASCRYTPQIGAAICERLADGESLRAICRQADWDGPHISTVYNWLKAIPAFSDMYVEARHRQADTLMDEVREVGLAATPATVWADRLRFDTLRWLTARLAPKKYNEKIMVVEAMRAPSEAGGMTVIVKRYSDITPEEYARAEEGEP